MRNPRLAGLLWIVAAGLTSWAAVDAVTTPFNQCDNIAGTCLRGRQIGAITAIQFVAVALAALCLGAALRSLRRPLRATLLVGSVIALAFSAAYLVLDPIHHLNHSRTGWLAR